MKTITIIVMAMTLMSLVSATSISPSNIDLNLSVGEQATVNLTINSDQNSVIKIESDNPSCVVIDGVYEVFKGDNLRNLTIYIPWNVSLGSQDCNFNFKFLDLQEVVKEVTKEVNVGGGGGLVYRNVTVYQNVTNPESTQNTENTTNIASPSPWWASSPGPIKPFWFILSIILTLALGLTYGLLKRRLNKLEKEKVSEQGIKNITN